MKYETLVSTFVAIALGIGLFILKDMKNEIKEIRKTASEVSVRAIEYNNKHLENHRSFEINICERVSTLESKVYNNGRR
jgi:hypothetical protein